MILIQRPFKSSFTQAKSVLVVLAISGFLVFALSACAKVFPNNLGGENRARFHMTTQAIVTGVPKDAKVLDIWMPYPRSKENQIITDVQVKSPYAVEVNHDKEYGNAILHARVQNPRKDFEISINFGVERSENVFDKTAKKSSGALVNPGDFKNFLRYDKVGALTPLLQGQADRLTRGKKGNIAKAKAIYDYMVKTYIYDFNKRYLPKERGDLAVFCQTKKGRCTELSTLFATLARASGIPIRYVSGYTLRNHDSGDVGGHCCWDEFWAPGFGWIPADLATAKKFPQDTEYYFGNTDEWRVELVTGRDLILEPPQQGPRINAWIDPYAEVDGKPFAVGKRISWVKEQ